MMMFSDSSKSLFATSVAHFINDGALAVFPLLYPIFTKSYSVSTLSIAVLAFLLYAVSIFVSPSIGKVSDKSHKYGGLMASGLFMLAIGIFGYSILALLFNGLSLVLILVPFTIIAGVGGSFYHPLGATVIREMWESGGHGRAMGINGAVGSLGRALFPLIVTAILAFSALPALSVLAAATAFPGVVVLWVLRKVKFGPNQSVENIGSSEQEKSLPSRKIAKLMMPLITVSFSRGLFTLGILSFIPLYLTSVDHFSFSYSGILYALLLGTGVVSQPIFGYMSDRFGRRLVLQISNIGSFIFLLLFLETQDPLLAALFLAVFGAFGLTAFPLLLGIVASTSPKGSRTIASSLVWGVGNTSGTAFGPLVIGVLAEPYLLGSLQPAFLVLTLMGVTSILLT
ncbi:MAG: MFS transporter, partial [Nitrososphaerales archaeon]